MKIYYLCAVFFEIYNMKKVLSLLVVLAVGMIAFAQNDSVVLKEVVVTGTRDVVDIRHLPLTVTVVDREELTEQNQTNVLPTVMERVPGLFVTSRSMMGYGVSTNAAGGINMRGLSGGSGQLLVLIDGQPQYNGIYGHPISDSYQTMMVERVDVVRGPASVIYGSNAMGGVVNIVTRSMEEDGVQTSLNLGAGSFGTVQTEATNQIKNGKFNSTVSAQYNRTDNHRPRMGFEQYGGYVKLGYDMAEHWKASADVNLTHFNASNPGSLAKPLYDADQWITRGTASATVENRYDNTSGAISVYSSFGWHKIDDGTDNPDVPTTRYFRSEDALTGVSLYQSATLFKGNRLTAGIDYQHIYGNAYYTSKATGETLETQNKQSGKSIRDEIAGYLDVRQEIVSWLTVDAGLRCDHHSVTGTELVPQAGLVVRPIETGEIKAIASKGFRNPTMRELYLYPPSNEDLKPERIWNYELSWKHRPGDFVYGVNLYYLKGDNMIQTVMIDGKPKNVNTGIVENCGVELEATWHMNDCFSFTTNHSFLHMRYKVVAAPEYKGYLGADFRYNRWGANTGVQYINGLYKEVGANEQKVNFCLLNAAVSFAIIDDLKLWVRGENLLDQEYEIMNGFPMPGINFMGGINWKF